MENETARNPDHGNPAGAGGMNHYQKLGVFVVRCIGAAIAAYGLPGPIMYFLAGSRGWTTHGESSTALLLSCIPIIIGSLIITLSRPMGTLLGKGLD